MRRLPFLSASATGALLALTLATASAATASPIATKGKPAPAPPTATTIAGGLLSPLSAAVGPKGTTYVTQNFGGLLTAVKDDGTQTVLYASGGSEVGGVSYDFGTITFTETGPTTTVKQLRTDWKGNPVGTPTVLADTGTYEQNKNPDAGVTYGFRNLPQSCLDQVPADFPIPAKYTGIADSHPYATVRLGPVTFVADAGANSILSVDWKGRIRTLAVLPAQPTVIPGEVGQAFGLPECAFGATYWFEPVPTDVEIGPWGQLYVTTLPGGPEDASLGARGSVYTVNPITGKVKPYASGFLGATNLAVSPTGKVFVTQLFGGEISLVSKGAPTTYYSAPLPAAVEWSPGGLVATTNALPGENEPPAGELVRISLTKGAW